jgi:hypothetical protein
MSLTVIYQRASAGAVMSVGALGRDASNLRRVPQASVRGSASAVTENLEYAERSEAIVNRRGYPQHF